MLCAAVFNVFSPRYHVRYGSLPVVVFTMALGSGFLLVLALFLSPPLTETLALDLEGWIVVVALAIPGAARFSSSRRRKRRSPLASTRSRRSCWGPGSCPNPSHCGS